MFDRIPMDIIHVPLGKVDSEKPCPSGYPPTTVFCHRDNPPNVSAQAIDEVRGSPHPTLAFVRLGKGDMVCLCIRVACPKEGCGSIILGEGFPL
jgi:hypothetical protein